MVSLELAGKETKLRRKRASNSEFPGHQRERKRCIICAIGVIIEKNGIEHFGDGDLAIRLNSSLIDIAVRSYY